jgi:hypothetical protein
VRSRKVALTAAISCFVAAALTFAASNHMNWFNYTQEFRGAVISRFGFRLSELSSTKNSAGDTYHLSSLAMTIGPALLLAGGVGLLLSTRRRLQLGLVILIAVTVGSLMSLTGNIVVDFRPGITNSASSVTVSFAPGAVVGACGAVAAIVADIATYVATTRGTARVADSP